MREIKVGFARYYNRRHNRRGYFWGDRFKSVIVDKGETLVNCLAYVDLNLLRAGIVDRPKDYRWNSLGYHFQTENKDQFLSTDFGLKEVNAKGKKERIRRYRRYVCEAGALNRTDKMQAQVIDAKVVAKERKMETDEYVLFVVDSKRQNFELVKNVVSSQNYVAEFGLQGYPITDDDILSREREA